MLHSKSSRRHYTTRQPTHSEVAFYHVDRLCLVYVRLYRLSCNSMITLADAEPLLEALIHTQHFKQSDEPPESSPDKKFPGKSICR